MPNLFLSVDELKGIAKNVKENFQREANQSIRRKDWEQGVGSLASMEAVDLFLYNCSLHAWEFAPTKAEAGQGLFNAPPPKKCKSKRR